MQFEIETSSQEIIQHFIEYDGRNVPFTLLTYSKKHNFTHIKFYLKTKKISFFDTSSTYSDSDNNFEIPCLEKLFPFSDRALNPSGRLYANSLLEEKQINFQDCTSPGLVDLATEELDLNGYDGSSIYTQGTFAKQQTSDVLF